MSKIIDIINELPELLPLKAANETDISDAEIQLRLHFSNEYKEYIATFGAIIADGIELSGIAKSKNRNVVTLTKQERELNPLAPNDLYVIESLGIDGLVIWQDANGTIYQSSPGKAPTMIFNSLCDYLTEKNPLNNK